jgi:hypothetical protein
MRNEIPIIKVTIKGTPIHKGLTQSGRPGFILDVDYHLQDGRVIPGDFNRQRKKDLPQGLESAQRCAAGGAMYACFDDNGQYYGTKQVWLIDGRGMNPSPGESIPAALAA